MFNFNELFSNMPNTLRMWMYGFVVAVGIICVGIGVFKFAKGLSAGSHGQPHSWVKTIGLLVFGGLCMVGGFAAVFSNVETARETVDALYTGNGQGYGEGGKGMESAGG